MLEFAVSPDHREKTEDNKNREKYLDLTIELKRKQNLWDMRVIGMFVTVS